MADEEPRVCHLCITAVRPAKPGVRYTCLKCFRSFEGEVLLEPAQSALSEELQGIQEPPSDPPVSC